MWSSGVIGAVIISSGILTVPAHKSPEQACSALMTESVMKVSCAPPLNEFLTNIKDCKKQHPGKITCSLARCVVDEKYHLNGRREDSISYTKAFKLLKRLDKEQPATKYMNELIRACCLCDHNYLNYPQLLPNCNTLKYLICAVFSYLVGQNTTSSSYERNKPGCSETARNVDACQPALKNYCPCL